MCSSDLASRPTSCACSAESLFRKRELAALAALLYRLRNIHQSPEKEKPKGVNIKGIPLDMIFLSQKDKSDILFGIENNIDYIAASFVRTSEDVADLRKFLNDNGGKDVKIIAKIENQQGVKNFKKILSISDGIMVARGDMGVEIDYEKQIGRAHV